MIKIINKELLTLKNNRQINLNEKIIQDYIAEHPEKLGIDGIDENTVCLQKEKYQRSSGGRLDLLFENDEQERFEVEIQLGNTNAEHIIRTIEYWDIELKTHPNYKHYPVLIAENITGRFYNVINRFNGAIPIIVIQMSAYRENDESIGLVFNKVLDLRKDDIENDNDNDNRNWNEAYWEKKTSKKIIELVNKIFNELKENYKNLEINYTKHYIGGTQREVTKNYFTIKPRKTVIWISIKSKQNDEIEQKFSNLGCNIDYAYSRYKIGIKDIEEFDKVKNIIKEILPLDE